MYPTSKASTAIPLMLCSGRASSIYKDILSSRGAIIWLAVLTELPPLVCGLLLLSSPSFSTIRAGHCCQASC